MNGMNMLNPQAAIIKMNGSMVTIRSPALHHAMAAKQMSHVESAAEQAKKKKKKKKGGSGGQDESSWNIDGELSFPPTRKVSAFPFMYVLGRRED